MRMVPGKMAEHSYKKNLPDIKVRDRL